MDILDCVEIWTRALHGLFDSWGVTVNFTRTLDKRPKHSCALNLKCDRIEVDFLVWDSGEAELAFAESGEVVTEEHLDELLDNERVADVLSRILETIGPTRI